MGCGNPGTFTQAGELGIGAIAFNFEPIYNLKGRIDAYKEGIANCTEPLGQFKNDNVMMTNAVICLSDRKKARQVALRRGRGYLYSLVCNYHDTIPHQEGVPVWPERPHTITDESMLDYLIEGGWLLCGEPDEVAEQVAKYQTVGCDQLVFGLPSDSFDGGRGPRDARGLRVEGHPPVRPRPDPLDHPLPPDGPAQVPGLQLPGPGHHGGGAADQRHDPAGRHPDAL